MIALLLTIWAELKKLWAMQEYETKHTGQHRAHFLSHFLSFSVLPFSRWSLLTFRPPSISFLSAHCKGMLSLSLSLSLRFRGSECDMERLILCLPRGSGPAQPGKFIKCLTLSPCGMQSILSPLVLYLLSLSHQIFNGFTFLTSLRCSLTLFFTCILQSPCAFQYVKA